MGEPGDVLLSLEIQPTIIGAKAFHCPVRNGKEWYHLAMVAWLSLLSSRPLGLSDEFFSVNNAFGLCLLSYSRALYPREQQAVRL